MRSRVAPPGAPPRLPLTPGKAKATPHRLAGLRRKGGEMERTGKAAKVLDWCWFLAWGMASSAWCLTAAGQLGATFDEPIYLQRGLEFWHTGSHHGLLKLGTMPLAPDLQTLPLYLWERWQGTSFDLATDANRM